MTTMRIVRNDDLLEAQQSLHAIRPTRQRGTLSSGWLAPQICWALYKQFGVLRQLLSKVSNKCISKGWRWEQDGIGYDWTGVASDLEGLRFSTRLKSGIKWAHVEGGAGLVYRLDETQRPTKNPEAEPVNMANVRGIDKIEVFPATRLRPVGSGFATWDTCTHFELSHPTGARELIHASRVTPIVVDDIPMGASVSTLYSTTTGWPPSWIDGVLDSLQSWRDGEATVDKLLHTISLLVIEMLGAREAMTSTSEADRAEFRDLVKEIAETLNAHGVLALPPGDKLGEVGRNVAGVDKLIEGKRDTFCSDVGYSAEIVLMRTTSGLGDSTAGPRLNDHETIEGLQESICTPAIDRATEFALAGRARYDGVEIPTQWVIRFSPLATQSPKEKAATRKANADARVQDAKGGVPSRAILSDPELAEQYPVLPEILAEEELARESAAVAETEAAADPTKPPSGESLLSAAEIGSRLGVSGGTILAMRARGSIRGWKIANRWRFSWRQVQAALGAEFGALQEAQGQVGDAARRGLAQLRAGIKIDAAVWDVLATRLVGCRLDALPPGLDLSTSTDFGGNYGASEAMREIWTVLERVAPTDIPVLILGETGTGKDGVARGLHDGRRGPFVAVNCAALGDDPKDAAEVLLGDGDRPGLFEQAGGGTIFLDEVGELDEDVQAVLLRALSGDVRRASGSGDLRVRVVSATWREIGIPGECDFRRDLYERLAGVVVELPPLRERGEDILVLAEQFVERSGLVPAPTLGAEAKAVLRTYHWPGNIRELLNAIRRACLFAGAGAVIEPEHLQLHVGRVP